MAQLTQQRLMQLFDYSPDTGVFVRRTATTMSKAGEVAGSFDRYGYRKIFIDGKMHSAHRLAWLYVYGSFPVNQIDHINRIRSDNRISNLRDVTVAANLANRGEFSGGPGSGVSGLAGVAKCSNSETWRAYKKINRKQIHIGTFKTPELAHQAYRDFCAALALAGAA